MVLARSIVVFDRLPDWMIAWGMFSLGATAHFLLQSVFRTGRFSAAALWQAHFPVDSWRQRSAQMDVVVFIVAKLLYRIPLGLAWRALTAALAVKWLKAIGLHHFTLHAGPLPIIVCGLVVFLVSDFTRYLTHYLQHFVPALWEFHKVHHSATFLNPLTAEREHPVGKYFDGIANAILTGAAAGFFGFLFNFSLVEIFVISAAAGRIGAVLVPNALKHSHFVISYGPLEAILVSPRMHQVHHSALLEHWGKNLGFQLSVWDRLFGTRYIPRPAERIVLGLGSQEDIEHERIRGVYIDPFVKLSRLVGGKLRRDGLSDTVPPNEEGTEIST